MDAISRSISEEIWLKFFANKRGNYAGTRFEQLSLDILEECFSHGWRPTKASHDGNKDFVLHCAAKQHWAESKAYRDPISYHVVSPTLFMAILGDATKVIFLSRSTFKRTAKPLFAQYQRKTGREVHCFDGALLDNLIARSDSITQKYFPGHSFTPITGKVSVIPSVSMDISRPGPKVREPDAFTKDGGNALTIGLGEFIRIDVALVNESASMAEIKVTLEKPADIKTNKALVVESFAEKTLRRSHKLTMAEGEVSQFQIWLRGCMPVELIKLPLLKTKVTGQDEEIHSLGEVTVSRLYRIGLTGKQHISIRDTVLSMAQFGRRHRVFQVVGRSGTGKSRLLQELGDGLASKGYHVFRYDKEFEAPENSNQILRALLADLNNLPQMPEEFCSGSGFIAPGSNSDSDAEVLTRLIYSPTTADKKDVRLIARALLRSTRARKTAIIIDNLQNVDKAFAETLGEFVQLLSHDNLTPPALLILAVNLDLEVADSEAARLRQKIARAARNDSASNPLCSFELGELEADDVTRFVEEALHSPSRQFRLADYPLTQRSFHEHIPHTPLQLWETLRYLRDSNILRLDGDILVVNDARDSHLAALLRNIPTDLAQMMRLRWQEVQKAAERSKEGCSGRELLEAMRTASAIGATSRAQILQLGVQAVVLDHLVRVGLLQESGFGNITFFHQRVFHFFQAEFQGTFPPEQARDLVNCLRKSGAHVSLFQQFFILQDVAQGVSPEDVRATSIQLCRRGASPEFYGPYLAALLRHLITTGGVIKEWELETLICIGDCYQQLESLRAGAEALYRAYCDRVITVLPSTLPGPAFASFAYRVVSSQLSVALDERALDVIEQAITELPQTIFIVSKQRELFKAKLAYRKLSVIKNSGRVNEAIKLGEHAQRAAHRLGDRGLEIEALMDTAEIILPYGPSQDREKAMQRYTKAVRLFNDDFQLQDPVPVRSFVARAIIALSKSRWQEASEISAEGIQYASRIRNYFWLPRLRLLRSRALLCLAATSRSVVIDTVLDEIGRTQDEMNVFAAGRDRWANHYLLGKVRMLVGDADRAKSAFSEAIQALANAGTKPERLVRRFEHLYDIAVSLRSLRKSGMERMFEHLGPTQIRQDCLAVLRANDALFQKQADAWQKRVFIAINAEKCILTLSTP